MRPASSLRLGLIAALLICLSALLVSPTVSAQGAPVRDFGSESGFLTSINAQRAGGGLAPLTLDPSMSSAAAGWALQMAGGSFLAHAGDIISGVPGSWSKVGENVGRGQSVASLTSAFMASPGHRANIMDASYTHIGIAVYVHPTDGRIYTTHRFAALSGAARPAGVAPAPAAPAPAVPTPIPAVPTAAPVVPTQVPVAPTAAPVVPTQVPVAPTAVPVVPTQVPVVPTAAPVAPTAVPTVGLQEQSLGQPPRQLAFVDPDLAAAVDAKHDAKLAKAGR